MPGVRHEQLIDELEKTIPGFQRFGFRKAVYEEFKPSEDDIDPEELEEGKTSAQALKEAQAHVWQEIQEMLYGVPDGFCIDKSTLTITIYEVEVTGRVADDKLAAYSQGWDWLDFWGWTFKLMLVDAQGHQKEWDLMSTYYRDTYGDRPTPEQRAMQFFLGQRSYREITQSDVEALVKLEGGRGVSPQQAINTLNANIRLVKPEGPFYHLET